MQVGPWDRLNAGAVTTFNVLPHLHLAPPYVGPLGVMTLFEFCRDFRNQKTKFPHLLCGVVCVIRLTVSVEHRLVTDRRTKGQTDTRRQLIPAHS